MTVAGALDRRLNAYRPDLADERLLGRVDAARFVSAEAAAVAAASAPLQTAPDAVAETGATLLRGEPLDVFERRADGWAWLQSRRDRYVGYARLDALSFDASPSRATHAVASLFATLHDAPTFKRPPVEIWPLGSELALDPEAAPIEGFHRVANGLGRLATRTEAALWAHAGQLRRLGAPARDWVGVAERFLGAPYLWGGKTARGIDCSGLVQVALQAAERPCPRDSDMQAEALGEALGDGAALRRGDLFFWRGHVGAMVDGATLLHASAYNMACVREPLDVVRRRFAEQGFGDEIGARRPAR